jgi:hypothetical protein
MHCRKWPTRRSTAASCRASHPDAVLAELKGIVGAGVEVTKDPNYNGRPTPVSPQRADIAKAYQAL